MSRLSVTAALAMLWVSFLYLWTLPTEISRVYTTTISGPSHAVPASMQNVYTLVDKGIFTNISDYTYSGESIEAPSSDAILQAQYSIERLDSHNELSFPPGATLLGALSASLDERARFKDYTAKCRTFLKDYGKILRYTAQLEAVHKESKAKYAFTALDTVSEARASFGGYRRNFRVPPRPFKKLHTSLSSLASTSKN